MKAVASPVWSTMKQYQFGFIDATDRVGSITRDPMEMEAF